VCDLSTEDIDNEDTLSILSVGTRQRQPTLRSVHQSLASDALRQSRRMHKTVVKKIQMRHVDTLSAPAAVKSKRMPDVIAENKEWVIDQWLQRVNANPELNRVRLSDTERRDHVPDLLDEAVANACGHGMRVDERQRAAECHGTLRYHQKYSVPMLILEAQLLQDVIAECIRDNFLAIDLSNLIPDMAKTSDTISAELRESASAYMKQYEWHALRPDGAA
jgi:hypothetical protein